MNASKAAPDSASESGARKNKAMHAELIRAKIRQRRQHGLLGLGLTICFIFIIALITFSNGTRIEVLPKEARHTATLHVSSSLGFAVANTAYALYGKPSIEIAASGFKPIHKTLLASEIGGTLHIELSELPQLLHLSTNPDSDKTRWFIDAALITVAAELKHELLSGSHTIDIDNPYYQKNSFNVTMQLGKTLQQAIDLQPINGQINIATQPSGALISLNNQPIGTSPLLLKKTGGEYSITISHADYQSITENIEITNTDNIIKRNYRLAPKSAYVSLRLSPPGGVVLLNGKRITKPDAKLAMTARVKNIISYHKAGYFSQQQSLKLEPEQLQSLSFHLKAETGKVDVRSKPAATILVDGKAMGKTPQLLTLSALPHRIELRRKGYRSYRKNITPGSKLTHTIRALLSTESQARLHESPRQFSNSIGIELKLFKPNTTFVMGAPRYEKGQRANEFLRTIKLTRPFYISTHEVTNSQYSRFKKTQNAQNEPVTSISWVEAAQYCNWLSKREKLMPFYHIQNGQYRGFNPASTGYRLPSEAEWEWLARKASKATQSKFSWGDSTTIPANAGNIADEYAKGQTRHYVPNYSDAYAGIAPVGSYPAEKTGLYDITGNVSEWVHDVYSLIPGDAKRIESDPLGARVGNTHSVKGSNWRSGSITELRAAYREGATKGRDDIGFRIARYIN